ncbi:methylated-DNA--[protein]-cysteine S-methyltransferase [Spiribacter salilacus]|nr:methylated-DNA--[protein]-cysteine S-methyltransferase [Spiribacter salilacus]
MSPKCVEPLPTPWKKPGANLCLKASGTPFQYKVWQALMCVELGQTISYKALAAQLGQPAATRAVANAVAANPLPGFIPCHRVIRSDGTLGGYSQGIDRKQRLLTAEQKGQSLHEFF